MRCSSSKTLSLLAGIPVLPCESPAVCRPEDAADINIAIAVCKLLQGEVQAAEALLGFGPQAAGPPDPDIAIFMLVRLPHLPGSRAALKSTQLRNVALPSHNVQQCSIAAALGLEPSSSAALEHHSPGAGCKWWGPGRPTARPVCAVPSVALRRGLRALPRPGHHPLRPERVVQSASRGLPLAGTACLTCAHWLK